MSVVADTNILVRAVMLDSPTESGKATQLLQPQQVVVTTIALCEMMWVLRRVYKLERPDLIRCISTILNTDTMTVDRETVETGLSVLEAGGDFADGAMAFEGRRLGGQTFATFDRRAAALLRRQGYECLLLGP